MGVGEYGTAGMLYLNGSRRGDAKDMPSFGMNVEDVGEPIS